MSLPLWFWSSLHAVVSAIVWPVERLRQWVESREFSAYLRRYPAPRCISVTSLPPSQHLPGLFAEVKFDREGDR